MSREVRDSGNRSPLALLGGDRRAVAPPLARDRSTARRAAAGRRAGSLSRRAAVRAAAGCSSRRRSAACRRRGRSNPCYWLPTRRSRIVPRGPRCQPSSSASRLSRSRRSRRPSRPEIQAARARSSASVTGSAGATTCNGSLQPLATQWHPVTSPAAQAGERSRTGCDAVRFSSPGRRAWRDRVSGEFRSERPRPHIAAYKWGDSSRQTQLRPRAFSASVRRTVARRLPTTCVSAPCCRSSLRSSPTSVLHGRRFVRVGPVSGQFPDNSSWSARPTQPGPEIPPP
jgi:hypothetical protein